MSGFGDLLPHTIQVLLDPGDLVHQFGRSTVVAAGSSLDPPSRSGSLDFHQVFRFGVRLESSDDELTGDMKPEKSPCLRIRQGSVHDPLLGSHLHAISNGLFR